ncbi:hypothetical protein JCM16303_002139 [Sporobolomyces ruberrimus]
MASFGTHGTHYDWMSVLGIIETIRTTYRHHYHLRADQASTELLRLDGLEAFLGSIWDDSPDQAKHNLYSKLLEDSIGMLHAVVGVQPRSPEVALPSVHEILDIITKHGPRGFWPYQIPKELFVAALEEVVQAHGGDDVAYAWEGRILESHIGTEWSMAIPRVQLALIKLAGSSGVQSTIEDYEQAIGHARSQWMPDASQVSQVAPSEVSVTQPSTQNNILRHLGFPDPTFLSAAQRLYAYFWLSCLRSSGTIPQSRHSSVNASPGSGPVTPGRRPRTVL